MDNHKIVHNDIKPQNYLVKFDSGEKHDLNGGLIRIVLTDFGLASSEQEEGIPVKGSPKWRTGAGKYTGALATLDQRGGTPIFASPECLANPDRKDKSSDIFSLGRVFLFTILPKEQFLQFLYVPLIKGGKNKIMELIEKQPILNIISKMMQIKNRVNLKTIGKIMNTQNSDVPISEYIPQFLFKNYTGTVEEISVTITKSSSEYTNHYIDILKHLS